MSFTEIKPSAINAVTKSRVSDPSFYLLTVTTSGNITMTKIRRGNHIFLTYKGDHSPRHVHVYRDGKAVLKWDLENEKEMTGKASKRLLRLIRELQKEGLL